MQHSLIYDWKQNLKPFWRGDAVKSGEEKGDFHSHQSVTKVFVDQTLALRGSVNKVVLLPFVRPVKNPENSDTDEFVRYII